SRFKVQGSRFKVQGSKGVQDSRFKTVILSGDKQALVSAVAQELGADEAHGDLLPEDKLAFIEHMQAEGRRVAFVGDGINDAPVLAMSDVGVAMGALGSDMAVETADVVIQTDQPSKVLTAISVGRRTRRLVKQNVVLALGVKAAVMLLGLFGVATLWEAVFADSGVALLAVLNAMRGTTIRR
ncbi:MAG: HAD-IC family P-type ATPase, partial [Prevotella sp.]|nr:HAD-IC family P-type ATPase [Prevotella sp.]